MQRERILATLRDHSGELKSSGIAHLRLFGSVARGEENPASDIDLLADFDGTKRLTLVTVASLEHRLGALLGNRVELSASDWMAEPVRERVLREAVFAF
jgi:predicted nucleotidyltransferase